MNQDNLKSFADYCYRIDDGYSEPGDVDYSLNVYRSYLRIHPRDAAWIREQVRMWRLHQPQKQELAELVILGELVEVA